MMTRQRAAELMEIEKTCVLRQGDISKCDRRCEECDLVQDSDEIVEAYNLAIEALKTASIHIGHVGTLNM